MVLKLLSALWSPGGLVKTLTAGPHFQFLTLDIWGEARDYISNKFLDAAAAGGLGSPL